MPRDRSRPQNDAALLIDMLNAAKAAQSFIKRITFDDYAASLLIRSAVERQVEIIGEAARSVSEAFQQKQTTIPWRAIIAQRHRLSHEYGAVDDQLVWKVATIYLPELVGQLEPLVPKIE